MDMRRARSGLSLARMGAVGVTCALVSTGAGASVTWNIGTTGNAKAWTGRVCGTLSTPVFQMGDSIGITGSLILGNNRCLGGSAYVVTEYIFLPSDAHNIVLHFGDFAVSGAGTLNVNGAAMLSTDDDNECDEASSCSAGGRSSGGDKRGGDDHVGRDNWGFLPGTSNAVEIAFGGIRPPGLITGSALFSATITFDTAAGPVVSGAIGPAVTTAEPGSLLLLGPGIAMVLLICRRGGVQSATARAAMRSTGSV